MASRIVVFLRFAVRHFVASIVSVVVPPILVTCIYFVLLGLAIVTNSGLGGPLALPAGLIFSIVASLLYTSFLLFPSVAISEILSNRFGKWKYPGQMLLSTAALALLTGAGVLAWHVTQDSREVDRSKWVSDSLLIFCLLLIPLGIYWWVCKIAEAGLAVPGRLLKWMRQVRIGQDKENDIGKDLARAG